MASQMAIRGNLAAAVDDGQAVDSVVRQRNSVDRRIRVQVHADGGPGYEWIGVQIVVKGVAGEGGTRLLDAQPVAVGEIDRAIGECQSAAKNVERRRKAASVAQLHMVQSGGTAGVNLDAGPAPWRRSRGSVVI